MPYFPPAPGGGVLLPNTITDDILADMPAGTVKGRALGTGTGDPQNLTSTQLLALAGIPFGQCRLALVSTTILRLSRQDGCLLTIDNVPQVIPAAGVDLAPTGLGVGTVYYIYAMMSLGVMVLSPSTSVPVVDPRNGLKVATSNAAATLVGMARVDSGPLWHYSQSGVIGTLSYFNRRNLVTSGPALGGVATSSTTPVSVGSNGYFICWGDEAVLAYASGYCNSNGIANNNAALGIDGAGFALGQAMYIPTAGANVTYAASGSGFMSEAVLHFTCVMAWVSGGTGNYYGTTGAMVRG